MCKTFATVQPFSLLFLISNNRMICRDIGSVNTFISALKNVLVKLPVSFLYEMRLIREHA